MESVGSYLPKGAARLATGGENFGEVEDGQTDGRTDRQLKASGRSPFGKIPKKLSGLI
jgi:hypothetical protein